MRHYIAAIAATCAALSFPACLYNPKIDAYKITCKKPADCPRGYTCSTVGFCSGQLDASADSTRSADGGVTVSGLDGTSGAWSETGGGGLGLDGPLPSSTDAPLASSLDASATEVGSAASGGAGGSGGPDVPLGTGGVGGAPGGGGAAGTSGSAGTSGLPGGGGSDGGLGLGGAAGRGSGGISSGGFDGGGLGGTTGAGGLVGTGGVMSGGGARDGGGVGGVAGVGAAAGSGSGGVTGSGGATPPPGLGGVTGSGGGAAGAAGAAGSGAGGVSGGTSGTSCLAGVDAGVCSPVKATGSPGLIGIRVSPAFPSGSEILANDGRIGFWYTYNDGQGTQTPVPWSAATCTGGFTQTNSQACTSGSGFGIYGAGMGFNLNAPLLAQPCTYDATVYSGISFTLSGTVSVGYLRFEVATSDTASVANGGTCTGVGCDNHFGVDLTPTSTPTTVTLFFGDMSQENWGDVSSFNLANLIGVHWGIKLSSTSPVAFSDICVDNVTFF